ncbi:MAG: hypothetical protein CL992_02180, partial [Euryarchaeota archaeon]|nr:hypothetical protein [Euryarchaeota archaeon]
MAAADTIQMFTNGSDSASFGTQTNIRADSGLLYDGDSVKISIPAAHSIVQASLNISVEPSISSGSIVYPTPGTANPWEDYAEIYASFVGDGSDTALSDETKGSQMTVTDSYLALFSDGNGSDFEGDDGGFKSTTNTSELKAGSDFHLNSTSDFRKPDGTPSMEEYIGGFSVNGYAFGPIADGCLGGDSNTCWGTNFDDYYYLDDGNTNQWEYLIESPI